MNELNYASLEASKKLVDNWIVLETDAVWVKWYFDSSTPYNREPYEWRLQYKALTQTDFELIPAPCFTDVWRELPDEIELEDDGGSIALSVFKSGKTTYAGYYLNKDEEVYEEKESSNPADALAELLIWVKGQEEV
jgi:hypothetical protein